MSILESPFTKYFHTNHIPSSDEVEGLTSLLKESKEQLAHLHAEIPRLSSILQSLSTEQDALNITVEQYVALLHPIRRVPQEILQEVFRQCLPTDRNPTVSPAEAPMLLTRICSDWRTLSLSTPFLWSHFHIEDPDIAFWECKLFEDIARRHERADLQAKALRCWLDRSGTCPLSISCLIGNSSIFRPEKAFSVMYPASHRWQKVELKATPGFSEKLLSLNPSAVPALKAIRVLGPSSNEYGDYIDGSDMPNQIFSASSIRDVSFELFSYNPLRFPFNWPCITHFTKTGSITGDVNFTIQNALTLFTRCSNLVSCRLEIGWDGAESALEGESSISLPRLESLWLLERVNCEGLVERLVLPALRDLTFFTEVPCRTQFTLLTLLRISNGSIQTLVINPTVMETGNIMACLRLLPNLKKLDLQHPKSGAPILFKPIYCFLPGDSGRVGFDDDVLRLMSFGHTSGEETLCPNLEALHSSISSRGLFGGHAILDFIRSRLPPVHSKRAGNGRLRCLSLVINESLHPDIEKELLSIVPDEFVLRLKCLNHVSPP